MHNLLGWNLHRHVNVRAQVRFRGLIRIIEILVQDWRGARVPFRMSQQLAEDGIVRFIEAIEGALVQISQVVAAAKIGKRDALVGTQRR